jgi:NAD+ synthase (glutamine-hydrolysing)
MKLIRVAAGVINQTPLDWDRNRDHILAVLEQCRREHVSICCLPELCITGYGCEDAFHGTGMREMAWRMLQEILPATRGMIVSVGLPVRYRNALFNAACLIADGHILGFVAKRYLASDGLHYEPRWFKPWPEGKVAELRVDGRRYPIGDLYFDLGGVTLGFEICEDAWVATRPGSNLARKGVDIILNPSASHFAFGKIDIRKRFVLEGSRAFGVTYVYSNLVGNEAGRAIYDGGALIASAGNLIAEGPRFSFADWMVTSATIDVDATRQQQASTGSFRPIFDDVPSQVVSAPFEFPPLDPVEEPWSVAPWEESEHRKEEEFTRAEALALFDYMRKSHSEGFVISLSGGADSAACSCLVFLMAKLAAEELGIEGVLNKLGYSRAVKGAGTPEELTHRLLTCAYQATRNSSQQTRKAARTVADAVGAEYYELDVDEIVQKYVDIVSGALGRPLTWETDDVTLQNIQARVRAPGIWMFANIKNALLLATSNRSEAAVGYATMDGDTAGGLSPIAGIDKAFLRTWLRWLEKTGPEGVGPIPAVKVVNDLQPTAELRPASANQTDEADLMPYPLLDAIERAAIRDRRTPLEVFKLMRPKFRQYDEAQLEDWVRRFFVKWARNQWKRERYAPSFHLDDQNLDPKTWCRFPVLSGGFEKELAELHAYVRSGERV